MSTVLLWASIDVEMARMEVSLGARSFLRNRGRGGSRGPKIEACWRLARDVQRC